MPLPLAPLAAWIIGLGLAWAARSDRAESVFDAAPVLSRPFLVAVALGFLVYAPIVGYFAAFHGDWSYLYLVPSKSVASALDLVLVLAASATIPAGYSAGRAAAREGRPGTLCRLGAGPAAVLLVILAVCARRLSVSASYAQYHGAFGIEPLTASLLGRALFLAVLALAGAIGFCVRALRV